MKSFRDKEEMKQYSKKNPTELIEYKQLFTNGFPQVICLYLNSELHGEYKLFYPGGGMIEQCFYINDDKQGECNWFYPDGTLYKHCFYQNSKLHGEFKSYNKDGTLEEHWFYLNGRGQAHLDYLLTERCEVTLALLFGDNYEIIQ